MLKKQHNLKSNFIDDHALWERYTALTKASGLSSDSDQEKFSVLLTRYSCVSTVKIAERVSKVNADQLFLIVDKINRPKEEIEDDLFFCNATRVPCLRCRTEFEGG